MIKLIKNNEILEKVFLLKRNFMTTSPLRPNTVVLGLNQYYSLLSENIESFGNLTSKPNQLFGMGIVRSVEEDHISLGYMIK
jgi:hypothetical protein